MSDKAQPTSEPAQLQGRAEESAGLEALQGAIDLIPQGDPDLPKRLWELSDLLSDRFERNGEVEDIEAAITALRRAVDLMPEVHPGLPAAQSDLGLLLIRRFEYVGQVEDIDSAILAMRRAVDLTPEDHPNLLAALLDLGMSLARRFERIGEVEDIDAAIATQRRAIGLMPEGHPDLPGAQSNLGLSFNRRFERFDEIEDIEAAITTLRHAVDIMPEGHPALHMALMNIGGSSLRRFERIGEVEDIDAAITALCRAVDIMPQGHPNLPVALMDLGASYIRRFERVGKVEDIDAAVTALRRAVDLIPEGHPVLPLALLNLGPPLISRFERFGQVEDIAAAITALRRAVDLMPEGQPNLPAALVNLGLSSMRLSERNGTVEDIDAAIRALRRAVELMPKDHPNLPTALMNLGVSSASRFGLTGKVEDIDAAVTALRRAVDLAPGGHPNLPTILMDLGMSLARRFERIGDIEDADAAIKALRRAVDLVPEDHPTLPAVLSDLGVSFMRRFERSDKVEDIDAAIIALRRAIDLMPEGHPNLPIALLNLGVSSAIRFERMRKVVDNDAAITSFRRAVELIPEGHSNMPIALMNLGGSCARCFERTGGAEVIDEAIIVLHRAVSLLPEGHRSLSATLSALGGSWWTWYQRSQSRSHFDSALQAFMAASTGSSGRPSERLNAAVNVTFLLNANPEPNRNPEALLSAHSRVLEVIPEVVWLGFSVDRRYDESAKLGELISDAVSAAITADALPRAVEWLEAGRSQVWTQVISLRTPLDELQTCHADLAQSLRDVQMQLQQSWNSSAPRAHDVIGSAVGSSEPVIFTGDTDAEVAAIRHRNLVAEYERLLDEIRNQTSFEDFLRPRRLSALTVSPELADGPVVFINVHSSRCDALILSASGEVSTVPLPDLSLELAGQLQSLWTDELKGRREREENTALPKDVGTSSGASSQPESNAAGPRHTDRVRQEGTQFDNILKHLWMWIVSPVLEFILSKETAHNRRQPHVTWCPTGPLMQLPLHAAGIYSDPDGPRAFDSIVSSYTPSLTALKRSSEGAAKGPSTPSVLVVTQPATPGQSKLPGTVNEGRRIQQLLDKEKITGKVLNDDEAVLAAVRQVVSRYPWVHLACHGSQRVGDATQSAFHLYDGPLSLAELMGTVADDAELAFLSACQTATGDRTNPEESAHLAAGMLAVGFKGVVATMWSIGDNDAPVVVEAYYKKLLEMRRAGEVARGQTGAAYALHESVKVLRERVGEKDFASWAPFVHFGV